MTYLNGGAAGSGMVQDVPMPQIATATEAAAPTAPAMTNMTERSKMEYPLASQNWAVIWQVHDGEKWWIDYSPEFCHLFENALKMGIESVDAKPGEAVWYTYNLKTYRQSNQETNGARVMRRCLFAVEQLPYFAEAIQATEKYNQKHKDLRQSWARTGKGPRAKSMPRSKSPRNSDTRSEWQRSSKWWDNQAAAGWDKWQCSSGTSGEWPRSTGCQGHNQSSQL